MGDVIRPTFGAIEPEPTPTPPSADEWRPLHIYGKAAGHLVGLLRDEDGPAGRMHRVVVGRLDSTAITTVLVVRASPDGEWAAERAATAILLTLKITETARSLRPA